MKKIFYKKIILAIMIIPFLFCYAKNVSATNIYVGAGDTHKTIQAAVNAAVSGDTIKVRAGAYHETVTVAKSGITIEAADPKNPPELNGADQDFANNPHDWTHVQGKIYKTSYNFPFPHVTANSFTYTSYGPQDSGTGLMGGPILTLYEDDIWLRGYEGLDSEFLSYPYSTMEDLDPSLDEASNSKRELRIAGRFMYDDAKNELYVWTAKEHGEDHPSNHKYSIPVLKNLIIINAPKVTLRNLVFKHTYYYPVRIQNSGDSSIVENCFVLNTGPWGILASQAEGVKILNNFVQLKGFYERQDYYSVRFTILKGSLIDISGLESAKNCEVAGNIVTGTYGITSHGQNCGVHDNIVSKSQSILIIAGVESANPPPGYIHNARIYHNILHHADFSAFTSYNTFPSDKNGYFGPLWFYRNVLYSIQNTNKDGCEGSPCDPAPDTFVYHNTIVLAKEIAHHPYDYPVRKSTVYRNNIFQFRYLNMEMYWVYTDKDPGKGWSYFPFENGPDSDYNIYWRNSSSWDQIARFRLTTDTALQSYKVGEFSKMQNETSLDRSSREVNPIFVHGDEFAAANPISFNYDNLSSMNYKDVISRGYENLFNEEFPKLFNYFNVDQSASPAINSGQALPSSWPDIYPINDGKPDIGAFEYTGSSSVPVAPSGLAVQ